MMLPVLKQRYAALRRSRQEQSCRESIANAACSAQGVQPEQHQRRQDPVQIEQAEHAPIQCGVRVDVVVDWAEVSTGSSRGGFALPLSLIQNSAPDVTDGYRRSIHGWEKILTHSRQLRCVMAQLNLVVGDVDGNTSRIVAAAVAARDQHRRGS